MGKGHGDTIDDKNMLNEFELLSLADSGQGGKTFINTSAKPRKRCAAVVKAR
jgi:hypothetical protein